MKRTTFHFLLSIIFLSSFLMGCVPASSAPASSPNGESDSVSHTYIYSDASILNPERGFFTPYELPSQAGFSSVRITGNTLVHLNIFLNDHRESDLPEELLNGLQTNFDDIREAGIKAIIRFAYNEGPYPDTEPDASKSQILKHIEQLTPLVQTNTDVIAWVEAGFIGAWGEWHTSTNGLDNLTDKRDILTALIAAIPNRYVQVRYPANIIEIHPNPEDAIKARVAHHNDCFLSSETDVGTYERDGKNTIVRDQAYLAELTRFTPMSGETCAPNPPRSECASAIQEMELLHFSAINEAYHKGILRSWEDGGCLEEITKRMGYRLALTSADFNEQVRPGGILNLTVNLQNAGFASIINERPIYVVVARDNISRYEVKLELDPRTWQPGNSSFIATIRLPSKMDVGEYQLALWLPDGFESLRNSPLYAVQFANENVWDESTGYNILGMVNVDSSATGSYARADSMRVEELLIKTAVTTVASTSVPAASGELISNVHISNDAETVYLSFDYVSGKYNAFQLFIDTDQNPDTGFVISGIGAEALFENGTWNIYNGSGSDWSWDPTEVLIRFEDTGDCVRWNISRSLLTSSQFDVVFQIVDTHWNTVFTTKKQSFTLR